MKQDARCKCGEAHDDWPGKDGGLLCQMCWEAECGESWWRMVKAIYEIQDGKQRNVSK